MVPHGGPIPEPTCSRCSKPITPGTAAQLYGSPVHMRCLAREIQLESIEQQDRAGAAYRRARAARKRAEELIEVVRTQQTTCATCGFALATIRGVLFQGEQLVHAGCWRADAQPFDAPPAVA